VSLSRAAEAAQTTFGADIGERAEALAKSAVTEQSDRARNDAKLRAKRVRELAATIRSASPNDPRLSALALVGIQREGENTELRFPSPGQCRWIASGEIPPVSDWAFSELVTQGILGYVEAISAPTRESIEAEFRAELDAAQHELAEERDNVISQLRRTQGELAEAREELEALRKLMRPEPAKSEVAA